MRTESLNNLNKIINAELSDRKLLGASMRIYHKGEMVFDNVYGSDKPDTIYKIYSMTKPITAVAVMILYERGLIDLADPVGRYLPSFGNMMVIDEAEGGEYSAPRPAAREITINDLLNMTSGLVYPGENNEPERLMNELYADLRRRAFSGEAMTSLSILNELASIPLMSDPGVRWHYGLSADVAGGIVEVVSGMKYSDFLKKEIFEPLGMTDTDFYVPEEKITRLAKMYSYEDAAGHLRPSNEEELLWLSEYAPSKKPFIESGGGGLYSTVNDYSKFALMLLKGGEYEGVRLIGRKTVDYLRTNQLDERQLKTIDFDTIRGYGYGNFNRVMMDLSKADSNGSVGEFGWDGLAGTYFMIDKTEDLVVVYMQQIQQGIDDRFRHRFRQVIYSGI